MRGEPKDRRVGIEKIDAWPCTLSLDMETLARARDHDPRHPLEELWVTTRSLNPTWEDPVTMAVNAATRLLAGVDREQIGLVIVGSESSPDFGKPMASYVHRHCELPANCRTFETKHACYGGTAGVMMAAHWVASGFNRGKKALVVCSDQSRTHLGKPWEYVLGAGATAMLIGDDPQVLAYELDYNGFWTHEIFDTYRPTSRHEVGHADTSLFGYLEALEGAYDHFLEQLDDPDFDYDAAFAKHIYHVPFGGMTFRAHKTIMRRYAKLKGAAMREHFERKSKGALRYNSRYGGTYTSATFVALMGLIDSYDDLAPGDRVSLFSYGSGSCAEFYSGRIGARAREIVGAAQLAAALDARRPLTVAEYERVELARTEAIDRPTYEVDRAGLDEHYEAAYEGKGWLVLDGVHEFERRYRRS
ncbi:MAG: hydroxymethylglutaryl-CoA synthase [Nannocystaceae bacterium]